MVTVASYVYFTPTPTSGAAPLSVAFVGVEYAGAGDTFVAGSWAYAFGDGQSSVGVQNPGHVYSAAGTYLVTMTGTFTTPRRSS